MTKIVESESGKVGVNHTHTCQKGAPWSWYQSLFLLLLPVKVSLKCPSSRGTGLTPWKRKGCKILTPSWESSKRIVIYYLCMRERTPTSVWASGQLYVGRTHCQINMGHDGTGEGSASIAGVRVGNSSNWTQTTSRKAESSPVMTSEACRWSLSMSMVTTWALPGGKGDHFKSWELYLRVRVHRLFSLRLFSFSPLHCSVPGWRENWGILISYYVFGGGDLECKRY